MEIKQINTAELIPGMMAAEDIFSPQGAQLTTCDSRLTDIDIARLRFHAIQAVPVLVSEDSNDYFEDYVTDSPSYFEKLHQTPEYEAYSSQFNTVVTMFETKLRTLIEDTTPTDTEPDDRTLIAGISSLLDLCQSGTQFVDMLHTMRSYDDITFAHSVNVSLICAVMGKWLKFSEDDITLLIRCGIYHDIGKLLIPRSVVEKPAALTPEEYNLMKAHTMRGYNLLRTKHLDKRILDCVMLHHERYDGSGYPLSITGSELDKYSQILAIADVYEAMTSPRIYRKPISPLEAIKFFESEGKAMYNSEYLSVFTANISRNYASCKVLLNNGQIGTIISLNQDAFSLPILQLKDGSKLDLRTTSGIYIEKIF